VARTAEPDDLAERRTAFAQELRHLLQQLDGIEALALDGLRDALVTSRGDEP
jgi:hypothetical protein